MRQFEAERKTASPESIILKYVSSYCGIWHLFNGSLRDVRRTDRREWLKEWLLNHNQNLKLNDLPPIDPVVIANYLSLARTPSEFAVIETSQELGIKADRVRDVVKASYGKRNPQMRSFRLQVLREWRKSGVVHKGRVVSPVELTSLSPNRIHRRAIVQRLLNPDTAKIR
ncbi:MAG: hypothetical protein HYT87_11545 [Nitrospirae bacterium]|nr:hypothetical protein [Nitrospirota bacterium]